MSQLFFVLFSLSLFFYCSHSPINNNQEDNADMGNLDNENAEELKKKIIDLELQLEYEINRHEDEIKER
ncbi:hypothetical protein [Plasmodium yoelii yoelii]|uniref:Uncharacterized protein n=1 Tax=Plasmodium yoelii yoelii TaxID=73239 RepID=Q7RQ95_PLAYO|nr:hypothetical protein [Plasmodium yoelii yoelii]